MSLTRDEAAQALGMKRREIIAVDRVDGGYAVTTHDGRRTLLDRHGAVVAAGDLLDRTGAAPAPVTPGHPEQPPQAPRQPDTTPTGVPDGNASDVMLWVGGDVERARTAAAVEQARERPRTGLMAELDKLIKAAESS
ncbi:hypothetical protein [Micromonospora aurantiaca (nom. illeg.)]|uniref:hypothetical protein n=1 Tax=Micromonospora aurantiaca (nom. illeg.) TaxID=47850 RepID=UPI0033CF57C6